MKKITRIKKRFGQHFLTNPAIVKNIIEAAKLSKEDHVIEVGPGEGVLTEPMLNRELDLTVVEVDRDLSARLVQRWADKKNLKIVCGDILKLDWEELIDQNKENQIISNLAYNISTPFFFKLLTYRKRFKSITLMLQKEVAQRLCHQGEGKDLKNYGILSIIAANCFFVSQVLDVAPDEFYPPPKVHSSVIRLIPNGKSIPRETEFFTFVKNIFNHRRQKLTKHLIKINPELYQRLSLSDQKKLEPLRPENLTPRQYFSLYFHAKVE
ncbi:MAG: 16S rRNA (adenine(1518)-N(6)/adenine(1519)-N(6))-dimethyltransferase RsmA [Deltaproteobacteria bacterium]|nr:16S rRNA (adenine(1518)-N(6)/adenine(1519)-N(6))-dimethyltransferase RsmA [Deltaproteobacteria bacterium]